MADTEEPQNEEEFVKRQSNKKFFYRGIEVQDLVGMKKPQFMDLLHARARRKFVRGLKPGAFHLIKRLRKAKKLAGPNEKPSAVKTRLRNVIIMPEMVGSVVGVYNGKTYITVEIKPDMVGHYLGEFSITYHPVKHGRSGAGAAKLAPLR